MATLNMEEAAMFVRFFSFLDTTCGVIVHDHFYYGVAFDAFPPMISATARRVGAFFEWCTSYSVLIEAIHLWSKEAHPPIMQCLNCGASHDNLYIYICPHVYCQSMLEYTPRDTERTDLIRFLTSLG